MLTLIFLALLLSAAYLGAGFALQHERRRREEAELRRQDADRILREHEEAEAPGAGSNYTLNGAPEDP